MRWNFVKVWLQPLIFVGVDERLFISPDECDSCECGERGCVQAFVKRGHQWLSGKKEKCAGNRFYFLSLLLLLSAVERKESEQRDDRDGDRGEFWDGLADIAYWTGHGAKGSGYFTRLI